MGLLLGITLYYIRDYIRDDIRDDIRDCIRDYLRDYWDLLGLLRVCWKTWLPLPRLSMACMIKDPLEVQSSQTDC